MIAQYRTALGSKGVDPPGSEGRLVTLRVVEPIGVGVAIVVISASILAAAKWLFSEDNRERAREAVRQRFCRHEWQPLPENLMSPYAEECVKCNGRR